MKRLILASAVFIVTLFIFTGCFNPLQSIPDGLDSDNNASTQTGGTVRVSIPPYAPWLDSLMDQAESSDGFSSRAITDTGSRAFLVADRVVLTVFNSDSAQIAQETFDPAAFYFDEAGDGTVGHTLTLPAGTGYTIQAEIYNLDESAIDPMVSGTSDPFAVTDGGETPVAITCLPVNPAELVLDTPQTFTQVSSIMDEATGEPSSLGGETWVSAVVPENGIVWFDVDIPDTGFFLAMALYDGQGTAYSMEYGIQAEPLNEAKMMTGDGYVCFDGANPGDTIYMVFILVGDGTSQDFTLTMKEDFYTIRGTVTVPGISDESLLPEYSGEFLAPTFNSSIDDWIAEGSRSGPMTVSGDDLVFDYFIIYDGDETAVLVAGIVNSFTWPQPGDWVGAWDGNTGTPMDFVAGTGIEPYHFQNNVTGIDFSMQLIESTPIPASAFPDNALRTAMEEIIGKSFTGAAGGVTDGDLLALSRIDLGEREDSYTELTGLELCDNVTLLQLDNNDLSGLDFSAASGTTNTVLTGMDGLLYLDLWNTGISSVEAIVSLSQIESLNLSGNHDLSYVEQKKINAANFPDMVTAIYTGYDSDGNGSCETMGAPDWSDFLTILGEFTQLINLGMHNTYITPEQFDDLYTQVLSADPSRWSCIQFGSNLLDNGSLTQIANLPNVYELGLWYNPGITDISAITDMTSLDEVNFDGCGISDLTPLQTLYDNGGFTDSNPDIENNVRITYLGLDLWPGTANRDVIDYLIGEGVGVLYEDGNTIVGPAGGGSLEVIVY